MGVENYLVCDERREVYDLGEGTHAWPRILASPETRELARFGYSFHVDHDVDRVVADLLRGWQDAGRVDDPEGYCRWIVLEIVAWADDRAIYTTTDSEFGGLHDGYRRIRTRYRSR